jgi:hypothetical protein
MRCYICLFNVSFARLYIALHSRFNPMYSPLVIILFIYHVAISSIPHYFTSVSRSFGSCQEVKYFKPDLWYFWRGCSRNIYKTFGSSHSSFSTVRTGVSIVNSPLSWRTCKKCTIILFLTYAQHVFWYPPRSADGGPYIRVLKISRYVKSMNT